MKSCIEWRKNFPYLDQINQFNITFKDKPAELLYFLDKYAKTQRVNIICDKQIRKDDIELIAALYQKGYNIAASLEEADADYIKILKEFNVPFYLQLHVNSWDALQYCINLGVSDVFITEEMGFDLKRIVKLTRPANIQIRCYANISQIQYPYAENDGLKGFYIRPEDWREYSEYVDVIEFYKSVDIQKVLYEAYFIAKEWDGPLKEIIKGLKNSVNNYYLLTDEFAKRRIQCRKKCIKGEKCQLCERLVSLANTIEQSEEYEVFRNKVKEEKELSNGEGRISERENLREDS